MVGSFALRKLSLHMKTSFGSKQAKQGHGVLYFSPERSRHMIALDGLAQILELEPYWLRMPSNQAVARDLLNTHSSAIASLSELPIVVNDTPSLKQEELRERIVAALRLQHSQETPIKLVVVNSVECLHFSPSANADLLGSCMTMLAELAKTEEIHVLCTVPVLRQVEERESHVPRLFDLWGEGIVEKFCDPVIAIYSESYYYPEREDDTDQAQILVLRNSWPGVTGSVIASFRSGRFGDAR